MEALIVVIVLLVIAGVIALGRSMKVVQQYEKGVLYRFGRVQPRLVEPGLPSSGRSATGWRRSTCRSSP